MSHGESGGRARFREEKLKATSVSALALASSSIALVRTTSGLVLASIMLASGAVKAQDVADPNIAPADASGEDDADESVIIVTGTNISGVKPVGSAAISLDRDSIVSTGLTTPADVVRTLPQVRNLGDYREGGTVGTGNTVQGNAINLRGLGASATLLLVDGRRVAPTGTATTFTEANQVPFAALARIEVIPDGASAIYGSDAVAGVVNYVLRKDYEGLEVSYRISNQSGAFEATLGATGGTTWKDAGGLGAGNIIVSYEHTMRNAYLRGRNKFLRQDLTPFGGLDGRISGNTATPGFPGNIVVQNPDPTYENPAYPTAGTWDYYGLPAGTNGVGLGVGDLRFNQANLTDSSDYADYTGRLRRDHVAAFFNQELGPNVEFFAQGIYSERETYSRTLTTNSAISIDPASPFYITGIPNTVVSAFPGAPALPQPLTVQYNFYPSIGHGNQSNWSKTYTLTGGVRIRLPHDWEAETYYTKGLDRSCGFCNIGNNVNVDAFNEQVRLGNINPLSGQPLSAAQVATFTGDNIQISKNGIDDVVLKFNGPLFALPAGSVRAAIGGEYSYAFNWLENSANRGVTNAIVDDTVAELTRDIWSAFGEIHLPVIGPDMDIPLVQELNINAAVRYDKYSDAGETTNPKFGATWVVSDALSLRGSWGTSFRAPGLSERNPYIFSVAAVFPVANNSGDSDIGFAFPGFSNQLFLFGSNADLKPEKATNWSIGGDLDVPGVNGLRLSATYYNIEYSNRIGSPPNGEFYTSPTNRALYSAYITPIQNPASCVNGDRSTYDQALLPFLDLPALFGGPILNPCSINVVTDGRYTNLAATRQDGIDIQLNYSTSSSIGMFNVSGAVTKIFNHDEQVVSGLPYRDRLGFYSTPVEWRGRGSVSWMKDNFSASIFANYTGSYTNDQPITIGGVRQPEAKVGSWTTFDLNLGYQTDLGGNDIVKGIRASINLQNVFDRDPPIVLTSGSAFNAQYSNPFGRTWTLQLTTSF